MLPTAGLYLPETLHRSDGSNDMKTGEQRPKLKYFQKGSNRQIQEDSPLNDGRFSMNIRRSSEDKAKATSETASFGDLVQNVRQDFTEASRLYLCPVISDFLNAWPNRKIWVEDTLAAARRILNEAGVDMDSGGANGCNDNAVASKRKFDWTLNSQKKLLKEQKLMKTCQHNLAGAIYLMQSVDPHGLTGGPLQEQIFEAPVRPWIPSNGNEALRGPYSRQKYRTSHASLSGSNVNMSELGDRFDCTSHSPSCTRRFVGSEQYYSSNSLPAELPGSTPEDVARSKSFDLGTAFRGDDFYVDFATSSTSKISQVDEQGDYHSSQPSARHSVSEHIKAFQSSVTVSEKGVERNDSITSSTTIVSAPLIGMRHIAHTINIRGNPARHRSLPVELPHVHSQPLLTDDLVDWVLPREQLYSTKEKQYPELKMSSTITESEQVNLFESTKNLEAKIQSTTQPSCDNSKIDNTVPWKPSNTKEYKSVSEPEELNKIPPPKIEIETPSATNTFQKLKPSESPQHSHFSVARKPLPHSFNAGAGSSSLNEYTPVSEPLPQGTHSSPSTTSPLGLYFQNLVLSPNSQPRQPHSDATGGVSHTNITLPYDEARATNHDTKSTVPQESLCLQAQPKQAKEPTSQAQLSEQHTSPSSPQSPCDTTETMSPQVQSEVETPRTEDEPPSPPKPMTAQAKRRAAHARRMRIAFGES